MNLVTNVSVLGLITVGFITVISQSLIVRSPHPRTSNFYEFAKIRNIIFFWNFRALIRTGYRDREQPERKAWYVFAKIVFIHQILILSPLYKCVLRIWHIQIQSDQNTNHMNLISKWRAIVVLFLFCHCWTFFLFPVRGCVKVVANVACNQTKLKITKQFHIYICKFQNFI